MSDVGMFLVTSASSLDVQQFRTETPLGKRAASPPNIDSRTPDGSPKPSPKKAKPSSGSAVQTSNRVDEGYPSDTSDGYGDEAFTFVGGPSTFLEKRHALFLGVVQPLSGSSTSDDSSSVRFVSVNADLAESLVVHHRERACAKEAPGLSLEERQKYARALFDLFQKLNAFRASDDEMRQSILGARESVRQKGKDSLSLFERSIALFKEKRQLNTKLVTHAILNQLVQGVKEIDGLSDIFCKLSWDSFEHFKNFLFKTKEITEELSEQAKQLLDLKQQELRGLEGCLSQNTQESAVSLEQKKIEQKCIEMAEIQDFIFLAELSLRLKSDSNNPFLVKTLSKLDATMFKAFQEKLKENYIPEEVALLEQLQGLEKQDAACCEEENSLGSTFFRCDESGLALKRWKSDWLEQDPYKTICVFVQCEADALRECSVSIQQDPDFSGVLNLDDATEYLDSDKVMGAMLILLKDEMQKIKGYVGEEGVQSYLPQLQLLDVKQIEEMTIYFNQNLEEFIQLFNDEQFEKAGYLFERLLSLFSKNTGFFARNIQQCMAKNIEFYAKKSDANCYQAATTFKKKHKSFMR